MSNTSRASGSPPARFDVDEVRALVRETRFADVRYVAETESTNADAAALLGTPDAAGVTLVAERQRAGAGRRGRRWIAPAGTALLFTAMLPAIPSETLWAIPFWSALAVAAAIERVAAADADDGAREPIATALTLQWPNDLLLDGRKVCGILGVSRVVGPEAWVGCGVGINVRRPPRTPARALDAPGGDDGGAAEHDDAQLAQLVPPPAFLSDRLPTVRREPLLAAVLRAFDVTLPELHGDPAAIARRWERRAALDGTPYHLLIDGEGELTATARRLDRDGALIVTTPIDGSERAIRLADARVLRHPPGPRSPG